MFFSRNQIDRVLKVIRLQHLVFIHANVGQDVLSDEELLILKNSGIDTTEVLNTPFEMQFRWGILSQAIGSIKSRNLKFSNFLKFIKEGRFLPLTNVERFALDHAKRQAHKDITGLGNRISDQVNQTIIEQDQNQRKKYEKIISESVQDIIENRGNVRDLVSALGHKTEDWTRDFGRISDYVMHQAFEEGRAQQIKSEHGEDAEVYKDVYELACESCVKLYLTEGVGSKPKIFKLSELVYNGTNIGRKKEDWKPVVGPTHPHSLVEGRTQVLTDNGYKSIKNIQIGEYVLTHKGRFRKVIGKINNYIVPKDYNEKTYYLIYYFYNNKKLKLSLTSDHKILTQRGWIKAKEIKISDKLIKLLSPCSNNECNNYVEFSSNKSKKCCSKKCESQISKNNILKLHTEEIRNKISKKVSKNWEDGVYNSTRDFLKSNERREKARKIMLEGGALKAMKGNSNGGASKIQIKLFNKIKKIYPDAELEYKFFSKSLDIAIPSLKIDIEYDGVFWHKNRKADDLKRDEFVKSKEWHVIRYGEKFPSNKKIIEDVTLVSSNSLNLYKFEELKIDKILEKKLIFNYHELFDIEVEEDESFIARGVVIHNCRCTLGYKDSNYEWDSEQQSFNKPREFTRRVRRNSKVTISIGENTIQI